MAFYNRFPSTDFNKVNLDWIMKQLKKLAPAAELVEQSAAALEQAQQTAETAQETAAAAAAAVEEVTADAAAAVATANEAKEIAQQAASATIADGSVTMTKLASDVTSEINRINNLAIGAASSASGAQSTADNALAEADSASAAAQSAQTSALAADTKAESAQSAAQSAQADAQTASSNAYAALTAAQNSFKIYKAPDAVSGGTDYDMSQYGDGATQYVVFAVSTNGANHNTIYYVDRVNNMMRLLGNVASGITPSISNGVMRLVASVTSQVFICPLPLS